MRLYYAGIVVLGGFESLCQELGIKYRLLSFADVDDWGKQAFQFWTSGQSLDKFFLDSGAFGALTRGATIDLDRYCDFIKANEQYIYPYAALDVIGDWRGSAINYDKMLAKGLRPMPAFHMGSPFTELRRLLGTTDHLALGGVVGAREEEMRPWLDRCFRIIKDFWPVKIHLFGVMAQWALERYPLFSADSSGAIVGGGMGRVTVFERGRIDNYDWREYARLRLDGDVMDHVSKTRSTGKSGSAHMARRRINLITQLKLEKHVTDIWTQRGIVW